MDRYKENKRERDRGREREREEGRDRRRDNERKKQRYNASTIAIKLLLFKTFLLYLLVCVALLSCKVVNNLNFVFLFLNSAMCSLPSISVFISEFSCL